MSIENYDVVVGIDRRGVAHVLKHRYHRTNDVTAEVRLTVASTTVYTSEPTDTGLMDDVVQPAEGVRRRVGVDAGTIKTLLLDATGIEGQWVEISGRKVDGTEYKRRVKPISVGQRSGTFDSSEYLYCHVTGGDTRTYRLDGIDRAEFVDIIASPRTF